MAAIAATLLLGAAPASPDPEEDWRTFVTEENREIGTILKVQEEVILAEGGTAALVREKSGTYHWHPGEVDGAAATVNYRDGRLSAIVDGQTFDAEALEAGVHIDVGIDLVGVQGPNGGADLTLYNAAMPDAVNFRGLDYFPYDPSYRVTASFTPDPQRPPRMFRVSRGADRPYYHVGDASFTLNGKAMRLPLYSAFNDPHKITVLAAFFVDKLTGSDTYEAGRYMNIKGFDEFPPQTFTIDFNFAYNPLCARSPLYSCPVATDSIDMPVRAGEKNPHLPH